MLESRAGTHRKSAIAASKLSLSDQLWAVRDRLLGSDRFHRWVGAFPLTRWIARRKVRSLFDLCAGFVYSQVLLACVRLRLFDILKEGPQSSDALARMLMLPPAATERLLAAAVSLGLLSRRSRGRYGLGEMGAVMAGNPGIGAMVEHHSMLYADLLDPIALLRGETGGTKLGEHWSYAAASSPASLETDQVRGYSQIMAASQRMIASEVLDAYPMTRHSRLMDVGGGFGRFLIEAGRRAPNLDLMLFDLPAVAREARFNLDSEGLGDRAQTIEGDFSNDKMAVGADIISLVRIVHDHDDDRVSALLKSVFEALPPGGTILIAEPMSGTPGAEPIGDAYFGIYLFAMGSGRPRTARELTAMLSDAGFCSIRHLRTRTPLLTRVIVGRRPG